MTRKMLTIMQIILKKIITYGLWISLLTPLIVIKSNIFPFVFSKAIFFYFIIEILFAVYLFAWYKYPREFSPKKSPLLLAILAFLGISLTASIFGVNFTNSFFSTYERMDGVFSLLNFVAFFVMLSAVLKEKVEWIKLLRVSLFVSFIIALYIFAVYIVKVSWLPYGNTSATIGNPLYLGAYLIPHIFLGFYLISYKLLRLNLDNLKSFWLWFYVVITGFNVWALVFSAERGPQLALYSGIIIAGILYFIFIIQNKKIAFKKIALISGIAIIALIVISFLSWNTRPIQRLKTIGDFNSASLKSRLITWVIAFEGIKDKPILGWGNGNFIVAEGYHYNPERLSAVNINFDKIHNKILEVGIDSGFLGLVSYLAIFGIAIYLLFNNRKNNDLSSSVLIALLIAYFIQNLTVFDSPASYLALFLSLAFINFISQEKKEYVSIALKSPFLFILYIIIVFCFWQGIWQPWNANKTLNKAIGLSLQNKTQVNSIYAFYNQSFSYNAMPYEARIYLAKFVVDNYNEIGYVKLVYLIHLAEKELEKENKYHPNNILIKRFLAQIYDFQIYKDTKYILLEQEQLEEAVEISPDNPMLYYSLGRNYYRQFKEKKAQEAFQKYLDIHPKPSQEQVDFINKAFEKNQI